MNDMRLYGRCRYECESCKDIWWTRKKSSWIQNVVGVRNLLVRRVERQA